MDYFRICVVQVEEGKKDISSTLSSGLEKCRIAKAKGADLVLFPEMYSIGYWFPQSEKEIDNWKKQAILLESKYIWEYRNLAKELEISIAITFLRKKGSKYLNSLALINYQGDIVLVYDKVHTCVFGDEKYCDPGRKFEVCNLETKKGKIKIGAMICFDREFPESARILMIKGAEIIIVPNACELEKNRIMQIGARAYENMLGIVVSNYSGENCNGHSIAYDGIAFTNDGKSRDMKLYEADNTEDTYIVDFDIKSLRDYRERESWGNSYRKPKIYKALARGKAEYPFIRLPNSIP